MESRRELIDLQPIELMAQIDRGDSILFDSSGNIPRSYASPMSMIATRPEQVFTGNISAPDELVKVMKEKQGSNSAGGLAGWIDYSGEYWFGLYEEFLKYSHERERWLTEPRVFTDRVGIKPRLPYQLKLGEWKASMTQAEFESAVQMAQHYISAGEIYQVNLAQRFRASVSGEGDLFPLYENLRRESPSPMACYAQIAGRELMCSSPETFLRMSGRRVETRPIKGTRPRYKDMVRDARSAEELKGSSKENAELIMITDLLRNDLGRVCDYGSVVVDDLLSLEKLEHVFHLVSTVKGRIKSDLSHLDVLKHCLPGGSITGAPKIRAMEIIKELEPVPRGLYTGVVGYLGFDGDSQFNIIIRSLLREGSELNYHVGAGIVADSSSTEEYHETLIKAKGIRKALAELDA